MNKEKCEFILEKFKFETHPAVRNAFKKLIKEHFEPAPYKFEDLKVGMWVWDEKYREIGYITMMCKCPHVKYCDGLIDDSKFEENRFYPVTKAMQEKEE